jgi:hypothetical protein
VSYEEEDTGVSAESVKPKPYGLPVFSGWSWGKEKYIYIYVYI